MKITKLNYFAEFNKIDKKHLDEATTKAHEMLDRVTGGGKDWTKVNGSASLTKMASNQFESIELILEEHKPAKPTKERPKKQKHAAAENDHYTIKKAAQNIRKNAPKYFQGSPVETIDPHLAILTRYRRLHEKAVPKERIVSLARTLVKQIEARVLRKKSEHAHIVEEMKQHLFQLIKKGRGAQISVKIPEKTLASIDKVIFSEHKMKSVQLLSRYAGMAGRLTTLVKAKKLFSDMYSAIEKNTIPEDDRYIDRITDTMKNLKAYIEDEDESAELELLPAELSGILGCGCKTEDSLNGFDEYYDQQEEQEQDEEPRKHSSAPIPSTEFVKQRFNHYQIAEPWVKVFGLIEPGKHTVIFSKEKLGKTTMLVDFAGYLSRNHGSVLFIQKEEELSGTFQDKFENTQAANPDFYVDDKLPDDLNDLRQYKFVFLDSVSRLGLNPAQLMSLQKHLGKGTTLFAILHATKDGQHRGANDYLHDAAQIVEMPEYGVAKGRGRFKYCTGEPVRFTEPRQ